MYQRCRPAICDACVTSTRVLCAFLSCRQSLAEAHYQDDGNRHRYRPTQQESPGLEENIRLDTEFLLRRYSTHEPTREHGDKQTSQGQEDLVTELACRIIQSQTVYIAFALEAINSNLDDHSARLDLVAFYHLQSAHRGYHDICLAADGMAGRACGSRQQ